MRIKDTEDAGARRQWHSKGRLRWRIPGSVLATVMLVGGCGRFHDEFRGDTDAGRIQLDVERVARARIDDVTQLRLRERAYERVFTGHLPVDAEVAVSASVAKVGVYRRGGSWVFEGQRYFGRHAVWARTLGVASSDPDCVAVHVEPVAGPPARDRMVNGAGVTYSVTSVTCSRCIADVLSWYLQEFSNA